MAFYSLFIRKRAVPQNSTRNSSVLWHFILYSSQKGQFPRTPPVQFCGILYSSLKGQLPRGNIWWGVGQWGPRGRGSVTTSHSCCRLSCFICDVYTLLQDVLAMPEHWGGGGVSVMPECFYGISCYGGGVMPECGRCYVWVYMFMFILVMNPALLWQPWILLGGGGVVPECLCSCSFLLFIKHSCTTTTSTLPQPFTHCVHSCHSTSTPGSRLSAGPSQAISTPTPGLLQTFGIKRLQAKVIIPAEMMKKVRAGGSSPPPPTSHTSSP